MPSLNNVTVFRMYMKKSKNFLFHVTSNCSTHGLVKFRSFGDNHLISCVILVSGSIAKNSCVQALTESFCLGGDGGPSTSDKRGSHVLNFWLAAVGREYSNPSYISIESKCLRLWGEKTRPLAPASSQEVLKWGMEYALKR